MKNASRAISATILVILAMVFSFGELEAKYQTSIADTAQARIARFGVELVQSETSYDLSDNGFVYHSFSIKNHSEVTVQYDVILTFSQPIPDGIRVGLEGYNGHIAVSNHAPYTYTFSNAGQFKPNDKSIQVKKIIFSSEKISETDTIEFTISIVARQVD